MLKGRRRRAWLEFLRSIVRGDVLAETGELEPYSVSASLHKIKPVCAVCPRDSEDVVRVVEAARTEGIPITARGAGTSRCGQAVGAGVILDMSVYMRRILEVSSSSESVLVEPGVVLAELDAFLAEAKYFFPPNPSSSKRCTIGGMIANDSAGSRTVKYGSTRRYVRALEVVLSSGEQITTKRLDFRSIDYQDKSVGTSHESALYRGILDLVNRYAGEIREKSRSVQKDVAGYNIWEVVNSAGIDLSKLLIGSEGTLGIVTRAELGVIPLPRYRRMLLVGIRADNCLGEITCHVLAKYSPSMVEYIDLPTLEAVREKIMGTAHNVLASLRSSLLIELEDDDESALLSRCDYLQRDLIAMRLADDVMLARNSREEELFLMVRRAASASLKLIENGLDGKKPLLFIEDGAVNPLLMGEYLHKVREILSCHDADLYVHGHAGDGHLHIIPALDVSQSKVLEKMKLISDEVCEVILSLGGTVSAEHGDGRLRSHLLRRQFGNLYPALCDIKNLFDPAGILNPGIIVTELDHLPVESISYRPGYLDCHQSSLTETEVLANL